jgi:hypothetical protein
MSTSTLEVGRNLVRATPMPFGPLLRAYYKEAKYESIRMLRAPAFAMPFLSLPVVLYLFFGVFLAGSMSHADPTVAIFMFVNWGVFGVMGPGMFGFGCVVAMERDQGLLTLKRTMPMPPAAHLMAKMIMALVFGIIIILSLIIGALLLGHPHLTAGQILGDNQHSRLTYFLRRGPVHRRARNGQERTRLREPCLLADDASWQLVLPPAQIHSLDIMGLTRILSGPTGPRSDGCAHLRHTHRAYCSPFRPNRGPYLACNSPPRARGLREGSLAHGSCRGLPSFTRSAG